MRKCVRLLGQPPASSPVAPYAVMAAFLVQGANRARVQTTSAQGGIAMSAVRPVPQEVAPNPTPSKLHGRWECKGCQHVNKDSFARCWACGSYRSSAAGGLYVCQGKGCQTINNRYLNTLCSSCSAPFTGSRDWVCEACLHENNRKDLSCANCKVQQPLSWSCKHCGCGTTSVFSHDCRRCGVPRGLTACVSLPRCANCGSANHRSSVRCVVCMAANATFVSKENGDTTATATAEIAKPLVPPASEAPAPAAAGPREQFALRPEKGPTSDSLPIQAPAPSPPPVPSPVSSPSRPAHNPIRYSWRCKHCSNVSDGSVTKCGKCGVTQHPKVHKVVFNPRWVCKSCKTSHSTRVVQCPNCKAAREKADLKCGCCMCGATEQPLGDVCSGCGSTVQPSYTCSRCARLTPMTDDHKCVWCSLSIPPAATHFCIACGEESQLTRCATCARHNAVQKWVCQCLTINAGGACAECDAPSSKALVVVPGTWQCPECTFVWSCETSVCYNTENGPCGGRRSFPTPIKCHECGKLSKWDSTGTCEHCAMNLWPSGARVHLQGKEVSQARAVTLSTDKVVASDERTLESFLNEVKGDASAANAATKPVETVPANKKGKKRVSVARATQSGSGGNTARGKSKTGDTNTRDSGLSVCGLCGHANVVTALDCAKCGIPLQL